ncbi:MAG TPA: NUDIX hydrolase [Terriglobales bacterium]|nr:NUDIX hydrolase [Terriglobales bacterium]
MSNSKKVLAQVISSKVVYRGPVFHVTTDYVREPGGITARRDVVRHTGSVVIMPVRRRRGRLEVLLVRQYRHAARRALWELAAGRIDAGESEPAAARRELAEETGLAARRWKRVLFFYPSPGFLDETMAIYLAQGLRHGDAQPEEDEVIEQRFWPLAEAVEMVMRGRIRDGKTIAGLLWLVQKKTGSRSDLR